MRGYRTLGIFGLIGAFAGSMVPSLADPWLLRMVDPPTGRPAVPRSGRPTAWAQRGRIRGEREAERARRQWEQIRARRAVRWKVKHKLAIAAEMLLDANLPRPAYYQFDFTAGVYRPYLVGGGARTFFGVDPRPMMTIIDEPATMSESDWHKAIPRTPI